VIISSVYSPYLIPYTTSSELYRSKPHAAFYKLDMILKDKWLKEKGSMYGA
jgi:hypothetical protein